MSISSNNDCGCPAIGCADTPWQRGYLPAANTPLWPDYWRLRQYARPFFGFIYRLYGIHSLRRPLYGSHTICSCSFRHFYNRTICSCKPRHSAHIRSHTTEPGQLMPEPVPAHVHGTGTQMHWHQTDKQTKIPIKIGSFSFLPRFPVTVSGAFS